MIRPLKDLKRPKRHSNDFKNQGSEVTLSNLTTQEPWALSSKLSTPGKRCPQGVKQA